MDNKQRRITVVINGKEQIERLSESHHDDENVSNNVLEKLSNPLKKDRPFFTDKKEKIVTKYKRGFLAFKKVWLSAATALFIGTTFGMLMLMMFTGESSVLEDIEGKAAANEHISSSSQQVKNLNLKLTIVQGGAFETKESANAFSNRLMEKGFPAAIDEMDSPIRMYIGIGTTKDNLLAIAEEYDKLGQEVYLKEIEVAPTIELEEEKTKLLVEGKQLLVALMKETETLFNGIEKEMNRKKTTAELKKWQVKWNETNKEEVQSIFSQALLQADAAIETANNEKRKDKLWEAEQYLLSAFLHYKKILNSD